MEDVRIVISGLWVATMLTYIWGDVLTQFAGDFVAGEIGGTKMTQPMLLGIAGLMMIPVVMIVLSLTLQHPLIRWTNIIVAIFWIGFNLLSLQGYPAYNKILMIISMVFNALTVWYAWNWA